MNWADVFTAYHSTGIRNIEAYFEADIASRLLYHIGAGIADVTRFASVQSLLDVAAGAWPEGPSESRRRTEQVRYRGRSGRLLEATKLRPARRLRTDIVLRPKLPSPSRSGSCAVTSSPAFKLRQKSMAPISYSASTGRAARNCAGLLSQCTP